jgi:RNA polymerase sigma-70 factor (ECF subfamily)
VSEGNMPALLETLAADVVVYSDGGGKVNAARKPVIGREKVATFLTGVRKLGPEDMQFRIEAINGQPGVVSVWNGLIFNVTTFDITESGIGVIYVMANPDKLQPIADSLALGIVPPELRHPQRKTLSGEHQ